MTNYYLAVDIGASSGRHILGWMEDGALRIEEVYRFPNGMEPRDGALCWDTEQLFKHIKAGMKECARRGKIPQSMGVDTWAVDFALLDEEGRLLGKTVGYRDGRTAGMDESVYRKVSEEELYARTGIQKQIFNTIYQLEALKNQAPEELNRAQGFLMIPDYFHYLLTGKRVQEYTNATTTQLVNPETGDWDWELICSLGLPERLFGPLSMPGTLVGELLPEIADEVGFTCQVVLPATHDTASAVLAVPSDRQNPLYISSGTWSLMGTEEDHADCGPRSREANLTNEGGYEHRYRYLKNIMGLWMIQSVRKEWQQRGEDYSFAQICENAAGESISSIVDCNDSRFLAPESMEEAVAGFCRETGQPVPENHWQMAAVIYNSLARCYGECAAQLEALTGRTYDCIHVVGGGANADYLNRLTAKATGKQVYAGPTEATAIGNLEAQMLAAGEFESVEAARRCIFRSFGVKTYEPEEG